MADFTFTTECGDHIFVQHWDAGGHADNPFFTIAVCGAHDVVSYSHLSPEEFEQFLSALKGFAAGG